MHIELHRTFHELSQNSTSSSEEDALYPTGTKLSWESLLKEHRVVILSEAGSGKTEELRVVAESLRAEGQAAFFLRLENVASDFDAAFEFGTLAEFESWLASSDSGWLLLDSVDESRLRDPADFARALRRVSARLAAAKQRTHIVITGRAAAWRPRSDRDLCQSLFPFVAPPEEAETEVQGRAVALRSARGLQQGSGGFRVVALDDLSREQIESFARAKGVEDVEKFLDAVERADAWSFTARPQDLLELTEFWNDTRTIGTRFELMRNSIQRRLSERDQNRDEARPLTVQRAREGAKIIAAACTLVQEQSIRVPDGIGGQPGLTVTDLLPDWTSVDCVTLLTRPIFDEEIYGTVRFHHRSVREYLTAEWFADLLLRETSRHSIEQLFFRTQFGIEVVVPSLRPILPWLVALDSGILERVCRIAPEILFEGGDPVRLPVEVRRKVLREACAQLATGATNRSMADFAAIQRFAASDLTDDIRSLLHDYSGHEDVQSFLLRMVWQGRLHKASPEALAAASAPSTPRYARIAAIRAVREIGSEGDFRDVLRSVVEQPDALDRRVLSELLNGLEPTREAAEWLAACLDQVAELKRFEVDHLGDDLASFATKLYSALQVRLLERFYELLQKPPVIERQHCEVSERYRWLLRPAAALLESMLDEQDSEVLNPSALAILRLLPRAAVYSSDVVDKEGTGRLAQQVAQWAALKWALFWSTVETERSRSVAKGERLTHFRMAMFWPSYLSFDTADFEHAVSEISNTTEIDDQLVALTLAFRIYVEGGRQPGQRQRLKKAAELNKDLAACLTELLHPPKEADESLKLKRSAAAWERRAKAQQRKREGDRLKWVEGIKANIEKVRDPGFSDPTAISNWQYYLLEQMRQTGSSSRSTWSHSHWQVLEPEFGSEAACAFREGAVAFWRRYSPQLLSEGAPPNQTPLPVIFGLTGIEIEAGESRAWAAHLSEQEVRLAFRYAMRELNGFPAWLARVFELHPDVVCSMAWDEIQYELQNEADDSGSQYLLYDLTWAGDWLWNAIAPRLLEFARRWQPRSAKNLRYVIDILQSSSLSDAELADMASVHVLSSESVSHREHWLALWTGVAPDAAIAAFERCVSQIGDDAAQTQFAMVYLTQLLGGRRGPAKVRSAFRETRFLKRLYLLAHRYIRPRDDIDRSNGGVYSPGLRDDAQDARERLVELIKSTPGAESFLALQELSRAHPHESWRPWFAQQAKELAQLAAEGQKWSTQAVREFNDSQERTPTNHRELFELAVLRLLDLKANLEDGDSGFARILSQVGDEIEVRKFIGDWCRSSAHGRYSVVQEEELADAKRPDFRWIGNGFDAPVPTELKLADNWTGPQLFERLEAQLAGDYLRDTRSNRGIYLLLWRGVSQRWQLPGSGAMVDFANLVEALDKHWLSVAVNYKAAEEISVIGIDLTKRYKAPVNAAGT